MIIKIFPFYVGRFSLILTVLSKTIHLSTESHSDMSSAEKKERLMGTEKSQEPVCKWVSLNSWCISLCFDSRR